MDSNRLKRVSQLLQQDLAEVFRVQAQTHFPGTLLSISQVRVSHDLGYARIYISIFPADKHEEIMDWIKENKSLIKDLTVRKLKGQLRQMPDLQFFLDDSLDYKANIDRLLRGEGESPIR